MYHPYLWDILKNIVVEEKEVHNTEGIKNDKRRNNVPEQSIISLF